MARIFSSGGFIAALLGGIFAVNLLATVFGWYLTVPGVDKPLHFLGGAWVVCVFLYAARRHPNFFPLRGHPLATVLFTLGLAALTGVLWEFFEFGFDEVFALHNTFPRAQLGLTDSMGDLFYDLFGAAMTVFLYFKTRDSA